MRNNDWLKWIGATAVLGVLFYAVYKLFLFTKNKNN